MIEKRRFLYSERKRKFGVKDSHYQNGLLDYRVDEQSLAAVKDNPVGRKMKEVSLCSLKDLFDNELLSQTDQMFKNYDRESLVQELRNKEPSVGSLVLVDGRPAVIKKRVMGREGEILRRYSVIMNCREDLTRMPRMKRLGNKSLGGGVDKS